MFDFGSSFRREGGTKGRNNKGLVTFDRRIKKDSYYVYKSWLADDPFVHIDGRRFFARPGETATVRVHSNQPEVTLFVDGKKFKTVYGVHEFVFENVPLSAEGTAITAAAGGREDTVTLRSTAELLPSFTYPAFKKAQDARNWFESIEEVAGTLETKPGFYSVHDTIAEIKACPEAREAVLNCVTAVSGRMLGDDVLDGYDPSTTVAESVDQGAFRYFLKQKQDPALRKMHAALIRIPKK